MQGDNETSEGVIDRRPRVGHYFLASYLLLLLNTGGYLLGIAAPNLAVRAYTLLLDLTYTFIYLLPALLAVSLGSLALFFRRPGHRSSRWARPAVAALCVAAVSLVQILILVDKRIYALFGFHINGFVLNLVTTPGGIESMGSDERAWVSFSLICAVVVAVQTALAFFLFRERVAASLDRIFTRRRYLLVLGVFVAGTLVERLAFIYGDHRSITGVMVAADGFPFYMRPSMASAKAWMGGGQEGGDEEGSGGEIAMGASRLRYPLKPLDVGAPEKKMNIVWLAVESLRADMLDPEIMPATWNFAQRAHRFTNHYSGGNGTRMGVFSMFYGLYSSYWFSFLAERRPPVVMDLIRKQGYQLCLHTSARFTYPEFDRTVFSGIPKSLLQEVRSGQGWKSDRKNVGQIIDFIKQRDQASPFMVFMFFESPHARYYFPPESVIRQPYLEKLDYENMDLKKDIGLVKNRYINAVHHLDSQVGRLLQTIEDERLLDDTIVIITGDHGEEFMEKGRWGHNSEFTEEQTRPPFVLWIPGTGSGTSNDLSSHVDIVPTIAPFLGVRNPPEDYSQGINLLGPEKRDHTIVADWNRICYVDSRYKVTFASSAKGFFAKATPPTAADDGPIPEEAEFKARMPEIHRELIRDTTYFFARRGE